MRKRIILYLFICILYVVVGCGQNTVEDAAEVTEAVKVAEKEIEEEEQEKEEGEEKKEKEEEDKKVLVTGEGKAEITVNTEGKEGESGVADEQLSENSYFPVKEHMKLKVQVSHYKGQSLVDEIVDAEIDRLKAYETGSIYKLDINITADTCSPKFPYMVRYFYVKEDEINLIWPFYQEEPNGKCIYFPDDDEMLLQIFDTEEKLQTKGQLEPVCREENSEYEDEYWFCYMKKEGDQITYYRREMNYSGDDMQKDLFVWEKGKGLVKFETGFGVGPMEVSITEIREAMDVE